MALMFSLKIIAMPPPRPSMCGWSMYLDSGQGSADEN